MRMANRGHGLNQKSILRQSILRQSIWRAAGLGMASLIAIISAGDDLHAASVQKDRSTAISDAAGEPVLAIVSLGDQRVTVYDSHSAIAHAPVSTGQKGRETPAGVFSVIEKQAEHYSNLYDDASMPHMQRITWSGIALHGGPLPGYAASHGCIRMPYDFATRLFDMTKLGMRVIVAPSAATPLDISHPALFQPKAGVNAAAVATARAAEAQAAAKTSDQAKLAAAAAARDVAKATLGARAAESAKAKADAQLANAERAVSASADKDIADKSIANKDLEQAEQARAAAAAKAAEADNALARAKADLQPKLDGLSAARETAAAAEAARATAAKSAQEAARAVQPVSVFISRKTQRLYVRQAFQPILESPVSFGDVDRPIGTHVFTAMDRVGEEPLRWSVVSLNSDHRAGESDLGGAKGALDRITIPQDVLDRIAEVVGPRSSLIISDEAASPETGKSTDFIVVLSDEPQGGIKFRRHDGEATRIPRGGPFTWGPPFASRFTW
jgi:L,D-transpeptidase catalytic domain